MGAAGDGLGPSNAKTLLGGGQFGEGRRLTRKDETGERYVARRAVRPVEEEDRGEPLVLTVPGARERLVIGPNAYRPIP